MREPYTIEDTVCRPGPGLAQGVRVDVSATNTDNDDASAISIDDVSVTEGDSGTRVATFSVTLDRESSRSVTVDFATAEDTAETPSDNGTKRGTLTFAPDDTRETVTVPVRGDTRDERNETFVVNLSDPSGATISDRRGLGTIVDDDSFPRCTITGTDGADTLRGTPQRDVICGRAGPDTVIAGGGNDVVRAGRGRDDVRGGDDTLSGGGGDDTIIGGAGRDRLFGRPGMDTERQ